MRSGSRRPPARLGLTLRSALVLAALQGRGVTRPATPLRHAPPRASVAALGAARSRTRSALRRNDERPHRYVALAEHAHRDPHVRPGGGQGGGRDRNSRGPLQRPRRHAGAGALAASTCSSSGRSPSRRRARSRSFSRSTAARATRSRGWRRRASTSRSSTRSSLRRWSASPASSSRRCCARMRCAREMKAIDSEYRRNLQTDARRVFQLMKTTAAAGHRVHQVLDGQPRDAVGG